MIQQPFQSTPSGLMGFAAEDPAVREQGANP
jgi:hypothetical protein